MALEEIVRGRVVEVRWRDLNANDYANVGYVDWALEALPLEVNRDKMLRQLDVEFLAQAFYGELVHSEVGFSDPICKH